ncbi:MAG: hypothetical protein LBD25_07355 [Coriobacteriales bacterium]|jgi:hypothetical protein|nr:hypothetical protein [Coriobacteriales bacterium]
MRRSLAALALALFLSTLALLVAPATSAFADDDYTATVKYYDDVQITYTVNYPNGGIWTGSGDIPIGGDAASGLDQLYCVDPFIHFHSVATTTWQGGVTTDTMAGYSVAAPWSISTSLAYARPAVDWLIRNGYRGNYLTNDATSQQSITRLQQLYPQLLGSLDGQTAKRICLMATKVAVWKVLEGDHVQIRTTSLPSSQQQVLDGLVTAMIQDAQSNRPVLGNAPTGFALAIDSTGAIVHDTGTSTNYYGPLRAQATLNDYRGTSGLLDKVLLTVNGTELSGVSYVTFNGGTTTSTFTSPTTLPTAPVYGTGAPGWYFDGTQCATSGDVTWTSPVFYLEVPDARGLGGAQAADELTIHAMAKLNDVGLAAGTPVTLVWANAQGIQQWNHVQAYSGAANDGLVTSMYADVALPLGATSLGFLQISKKVENTTPDDGTQEYWFSLYYSSSPTGPFDERVQLDASNTLSVCSVDETHDVFDIRMGNTATIRDLPPGYYQVVEIRDGTPLDRVDFQTDTASGTFTQRAPASVNALGNYVADPVELEATPTANYQLTPRNVVFTNVKPKPDIRLYVQKLSVEITDTVTVFDRGYPYAFQVQRSTDGALWTPADLSGLNFGGSDATVTDSAQGRFTLNATGGCYLDLPTPVPGELYRVVEESPDGMMAAYDVTGTDSSGTQNYSAAGMQMPSYEPFASEALPALMHQHYYLAFVNANVVTSTISMSKELRAPGGLPDTSSERLFPFQVRWLDDSEGTDDWTPVPLTANAGVDSETSEALLVTGVTEERLSAPDANGHPTVVWLKAGETATVAGLPVGSYKIEELLDSTARGEFATAYRAETANAALFAEGDGVLTASMDLEDDELSVLFTNTSLKPAGIVEKPFESEKLPNTDKLPGTGRADIGGGAGLAAALAPSAMLAFLASGTALLAIARLKRGPARHNSGRFWRWSRLGAVQGAARSSARRPGRREPGGL